MNALSASDAMSASAQSAPNVAAQAVAGAGLAEKISVRNLMFYYGGRNRRSRRSTCRCTIAR